MLKESQLYTILVVEDNLGDFVLLEEYIGDYFLRVDIVNVTSYKAFFQEIKSNSNYDIIFLDLSLPDKHGIDLIKASIELIDFAPIVVLTGYQDFNFAVQSLSLGVSDYLLKEDLSPATLHKCIIYNIERFKNIIKVKESEQYYLELFQFSPNPLIVYDENTLKILEVNDSAIDTYQFSLEEFLAMEINEIKIERKIFNEDLLGKNKDAKFTLNNIECHQKKNGELLYVTSKINKIIYKDTKSIILSIEDLTNEINQIQSIQMQNQKLKEIAWTQSHLVRAPLARIMGLLNLVLDETYEELNHTEIFNMVIASSQELDSVIKDIVYKTKEV